MAVLGVLACLCLSVAACGEEEKKGGGGAAESGPVTVYSSLPLQGANRIQNEAVVNGIKLALKQAGGKAGDREVKYVSLDDSTAQAGNWDPGQTSSNARKAAQDESTIGYIGEFNSGASAISIPILNEAGIAQISPANTYVGLTTNEGKVEPGEPDKYYPSGQRTYARIVPRDTIQAAALVSLMQDDGCTAVAMTNDKEVYGAGLAKSVEGAAQAAGLKITGNDAIDKSAANYRSLGDKMKRDGADCFVHGGVTANNGVQLYQDVGKALPDAKLFGPDGVAEESFADPKEGGIPADLAKRTKVTVATLDPKEYPEEGQKFFEEFEKEYDEKNPSPYAIYGYEAMNLMLDVIERSQGGDKAAVVKSLFETKGRDSVLGKYDIDKNGDTTITDYGVYEIDDKGELKFAETIKAEAAK